MSRWYVLNLNPNLQIAAITDSLRKLPGIESASPVSMYYPHVIPNDPKFYKQKGLRNGTTGRDIHATGAWDINKGRNDVIVAVLDGGIDYNHVDLDPGDRSRITQGYDTGNEDNDPMDDISEGLGFAGHGTKVAGVIGAITDNGVGVAGIMWSGKILPVKVVATGGTWWNPFGDWLGNPAAPWDIAQGIDYAKNNGAYIINMSIGHPDDYLWENPIYGNPVGEAVWNAYEVGVLIIASMGNDNNDDSNYPAAFPRVMAVGATDQYDQRASFSNYGSHISVVAPGQSSANYSTKRYNGYDYFGGTSCSAPMVAGAAGLIFSHSLDKGLGLTNDDVRHLLESSADKVPEMGGANWTQEHGYGRINVERALQYLEPPNTVVHGSATGGSSQLTWNYHVHTLLGGNSDLPAGVYWAKQYKVTKSVSFPTTYASVPLLWIRERSTIGWSAANPNKAIPWANVESVTTSSATLSTYVYYVKYRIDGYAPIYKWYPTSRSNVKFDYTVIGEPSPPQPLSLTITGPTFIDYGEYGTFTANPSGGSGSYVNYRWWIRNDEGEYLPKRNKDITPNAPPIGEWIEITGWEGQQTVEHLARWDFSLKCTVYDSQGSQAQDIHSVNVGGGLPKAAANLSIPSTYVLSPNNPNPFNPVTIIKYDLPEDSFVRMRIYDLLGREIKTLINGSETAGFKSILWDGEDNRRNAISSGIYIYRFTAKSLESDQEFHQTMKMVLIR